MDADRETGEAEQPPSSRPAWRWLWVTVVIGGALIAVAESTLVMTSVQGAVEITIALAAVASGLAWIRVNRGALLEREARPRRGGAARSGR